MAEALLPAPHFSAAFPFKCLIQRTKGCWAGATDHSECLSLFPEPHHPHLVIEEGTMTYQEYEAHIRSRRDYVRVAKRDSDGERQVTCPGGLWQDSPGKGPAEGLRHRRGKAGASEE